MNNDILNTSIEFLKGVGPNRAKLIKNELKISKFKDLLFQFPYRYIDKTKFHKISEINSSSSEIQLIGTIKELKEVGIGAKKRLTANFYDKTGQIQLVWFKTNKWLIDSIKLNRNYILFGKINYFKGVKSMPHPELEIYNKNNLKKRKSLFGVYPSTENLNNKGLTNKVFSKLIEELLININKDIKENLPDYIINKYKLMGRRQAIISIHKPRALSELKQAVKRLKATLLKKLEMNLTIFIKII